ncbi:hypothetical protein BDZ94DRAFT_1265360 [Collybia nuda]|uniref:Microbial-type PARG catalytic domain-containing protein n=1 Tax=Collybia nuda TaxID=64659 RepID=A0A9P5Y1Q1_9AGAR|nr:hypothetical protein BDZ94DRAFT_1265360 [Collybia nuda]
MDSYFPKNERKDEDRRTTLRKIAADTVVAIETGFDLNGIYYNLASKTTESKRRTRYFAPDSLLSTWSISPTPTFPASSIHTEFSILEISTLDGARYLANDILDGGKIGVLNFASAKKPGGGFLNGAQAQEESIARSSTLYPTLLTAAAQTFYTLHNRDAKDGYYSHAMIYSPGVAVFRDDDGTWAEPLEVDVLTSPAVNAGVVRKSVKGKIAANAIEDRIERLMRERMGRILFLFEKQGAKNLVLGSFGTGVFQNDVNVVSKLWAELLKTPGARFENVFHRVVFGILGKRTYNEFKDIFNNQTREFTTKEEMAQA